MDMFEAFFGMIGFAIKMVWATLTIFWPITLILLAAGTTVGLIIHHLA